MWTYHQASGQLDHDGALFVTGYAGHPPHVNDPSAQFLVNVGPLPCGAYTIGPPEDNRLGPCVMPLTPDPANDMQGRSDFWIHAERAVPPPGLASDGCIVIEPVAIRWQIAQSGDTALTVVAL